MGRRPISSSLPYRAEPAEGHGPAEPRLLPPPVGSPTGGAHLSGPSPTSGHPPSAAATSQPPAPAFPAPRRPRPRVRPPFPCPSTPSPARPRPRDGRDPPLSPPPPPHVGRRNRAAPGHVRAPSPLFKHHRSPLSLFLHFAELPRALHCPSAVALLSAAAAAAPVAASRCAKPRHRRRRVHEPGGHAVHPSAANFDILVHLGTFFFEILVHLGTAWMNGVLSLMSLGEYQIFQLFVIRIIYLSCSDLVHERRPCL
uniref:Uncharacterized protein n=1 Tax=Oryza sativa subsp. japonica TaxID=39947 RepID=Q6ZLM5_ORYSJ|nr:hypothetical protein [Oryza sativa Japonica Group]BAD31964.1 hypothetical protein [Oryza sativa Japonica Group]